MSLRLKIMLARGSNGSGFAPRSSWITASTLGSRPLFAASSTTEIWLLENRPIDLAQTYRRIRPLFSSFMSQDSKTPVSIRLRIVRILMPRIFAARVGRTVPW